jgi:hypothetical protein
VRTLANGVRRMSDEWLTYREAAERIGSTPEAVRYRAMRGKWQRRRGNDGRARIQLPDDPNPVRTPSAQAVHTPSAPSANGVLIKALQAHVETLKEQLAAAEARIDKQADDLVAYDAAYAAGLSAERAKVEAERAKAERALAAAELRAEKQASDFAAREAQQAADLEAERARADRAISAFASLADRLDQLTAERAWPWWQRLLRRA